jgi:hypothetical protein
LSPGGWSFAASQELPAFRQERRLWRLIVRQSWRDDQSHQPAPHWFGHELDFAGDEAFVRVPPFVRQPFAKDCRAKAAGCR